MTRKQLQVGGISLLMVLFFAGINRLEGDRWAQGAVALAYCVALLALMAWTQRRPA